MRGLLLPKDYFAMAPDAMFKKEYDVAKQNGVFIAFYDQESLNFDSNIKIYNLDASVDSYVYRGWMLSEMEYAKLERTLESKGSLLTVTTEEYLRSHFFNNWYNVFEDVTFKSVVLDDPTNEAEINHASMYLGSGAFFVKDSVKSTGEDESSYAEDADRLHDTIKSFLKTRDNNLEGNVIIRKFGSLNPNVAEVRTWWVNSACVVKTHHPNFTSKPLPSLPDEEFLTKVQECVAKLGEFFVTVDIALTENNTWVVVEVGNGQVSGLPSTLTNQALYLLFNPLMG